MLILMYGIPDNIVQEIALKYRFQISSDLENTGMSTVILNIPDLDRTIINCKMVKGNYKNRASNYRYNFLYQRS